MFNLAHLKIILSVGIVTNKIQVEAGNIHYYILYRNFIEIII